MFRTCIAIAIVSTMISWFSSALLAAPVTYFESVGGDLPHGFPLHLFTFDVGVNTISGNFGKTSDTTSDADSFAFTVPADMSITSASAELTDAHTGPGDIIYGEWDLRTGSKLSEGTFLQEFRVQSPGSASISAPLAAGTYNIGAVSDEFTGVSTSDYTFSFTVLPEPASLSLIALAAPMLLRRQRRRAN